MGIFRSTDNGENWILVNNGLTTTDIPSLAINEAGHIYAGTYPIFGEGGGIFRSTDNGESWVEKNDGLSDLNISALTFTQYGSIFAGTFLGVFRSFNNGETWHEFNEGLAAMDVRALTAPDNFLYAGTVGAGVWRREFTIGISDLSQNEDILIYPNPARDFVNINYPEYSSGHKTVISIYSIEGRLDRCLPVQGNVTCLYVSKLNPGIYMVAVKDNRGLIMRKLIIK